MVATRRQRADQHDNVADAKSKVATKPEGIKAPAKRAGRVKKAEAESMVEAPAAEKKTIKSTAQQPTVPPRTTTRSKKTIAAEEKVETEPIAALITEKRTSRSRTAPVSAPAPAEVKPKAKATIETEEKKPAARNTRKAAANVVNTAQVVELVKQKEEEEVKETATRATRSTASARARQAPAKEAKAKSTKERLPRSGTAKKAASTQRAAKNRNEVDVELHEEIEIGVEAEVADAPEESLSTGPQETILEAEPEPEPEMMDIEAPDALVSPILDNPRDESPEPEAVVMEEASQQDEIGDIDEPMIQVDPAQLAQGESEDTMQTADEVDRDKITTKAVPSPIIPAKRKSESKLPSPKKTKLDVTVITEPVEAAVKDEQPTLSKSSSMVQTGASIGSPRRTAKTPNSKLMLTPARNRFGDRMKQQETITTPDVPLISTTRPVTPPPSFETASKNLSLLNTCPAKVIAPPQSCLRKTKKLQEVEAQESPKKTVTFTVKTPTATPKAVPFTMTRDNTPFNFATPGAFSHVEGTPFNKATPQMGFTGSLLRTPKLYTPWTSKQDKFQPSTPGTVHWTWNPVTPAFQPPAVSPIKPEAVSKAEVEQSEEVSQASQVQAKDTILQGVKCYVEVRWQSGSDGSSMFISLLRDLGADVSANLASDVTHVLWGNGNLATLERVQMSGGAVQAVNLNWPMDCEKEGRRLDESPYLIDFRIYGLKIAQTPKTVTRTPRALSILDANRTPSPIDSTPFVATAKRLKLSTTKSGKGGSFLIKTPAFKLSQQTILRPGGGQENFDDLTPSPMREKLLQQTCPPKQSGKLLLFQESPVRNRSVMKRRLSQG